MKTAECKNKVKTVILNPRSDVLLYVLSSKVLSMRFNRLPSVSLNEESIELLAEACISVDESKRKLLARSGDFPIEVLYLRDDDIPGLVMDEVVDLGIVGEGVLEETRLARAQAGMASNYEVLKRLDFGSCRLCIALPEDINYEGPQTLSNKRIATSFPQLLKQWMQMQNLPFNTCLLTGSVEIAPSPPPPEVCSSPPPKGTGFRSSLIDHLICIRILLYTHPVEFTNCSVSRPTKIDTDPIRCYFNEISIRI